MGRTATLSDPNLRSLCTGNHALILRISASLHISMTTHSLTPWCMLGCQDYLVAMSLQQQQGAAPGPLSDLDLARQLQEEEYQQQQQQQGGPSQAPAQQVTNHTVWAYTRRKESALFML